ncbi:hypothetical protein AYO44_08515 [Planctomycetaceae bacterium SCGC AG-212-F19]|nr:hypothetical protein AYO44_08515 [Planctomycetaceae bacterium SCGC AG-212-F19]
MMMSPVLVLFMLLFGGGGQFVEPRPAQAAAAPGALPADLDLVPREAAAFVHVRARDLWQTDVLKDARQIIDRAGPEAWKEFVSKSPINPSTIDRLTLVMLTPKTLGEPFPQVDPEALSALVVVRTTEPYDRLALLQAIHGREKAYRRNIYYFNEDLWSGVVLVDEKTFLVGSEDAVVRWYDLMRTKNAAGPLQPALAEALKHHITVGLNPGLLGKEMQGAPPPITRLCEAQCATATLDIGKEAQLDLRLEYQKGEQAVAGEKALREALDMGRQALAQPIAMVEQELKNKSADLSDLPESFGMLFALGFLREMDAQLKNVPIQRQSTSVVVAFRSPRMDTTMGGATMFSLMAIQVLGRNANMAFGQVGAMIGGVGEKPKDPMAEYMKTLHGALEKYHADKGSYPPAAVLDKDGRPLFSWRVALLPYLSDEGKALYGEFRLDEPWDSLHNKRLLKKIPKALQAPFTYNSWGLNRLKTETQLVTGADTAFADAKGPRKTDLAAKGLLLVNAANNKVYWSKPADIVYSGDKPLSETFAPPQKPGRNNFFAVGRGQGGLAILLADGTYRAVQLGQDDKELRTLIVKPKK